jgi:5S rRNA maturation endonuclease (ribonuclease M5)
MSGMLPCRIAAQTDKLATAFGINRTAIEEAARRGLVSFKKHRRVACWRFGDNRNGCWRRLDCQPFVINGDPVKAKPETRGESWHRLIGLDDVLANDRRDILLIVEGSKDALAALHFADAEDTLSQVGVVAALSASVNLLADDIEKFRGRRVRIFGDADTAGEQAADRITQQLALVAAEVQIFSVAGLNRDDGKPVKDLFDVTRIDADDFERERDVWSISDLASRGPRVRVVEQKPDFFSSPLVSAPLLRSKTAYDHPLCVTKDNQRSTNDDQGWKGKEKKETSLPSIAHSFELFEIANSLACREKGKGHRQQFQLARYVRRLEMETGRPLNNDELRAVHRHWFSASTALPAEATEAEAFGEFIDRLRKVRILPGTTGDTLRLAKQRARALPLPEIPGFIDAPDSMRKIAALHRELQRATGDVPHFLTAEDAREFAALKHKIKAHRIQLRLADDRLGVLRCVKRGDPRKGGKPTVWLYLLPIPPVLETDFNGSQIRAANGHPPSPGTPPPAIWREGAAPDGPIYLVMRLYWPSAVSQGRAYPPAVDVLIVPFTMPLWGLGRL